MKKKLKILLALLLLGVSLSAQQINRAEYFFDTDPGFGNGTQITFAAADSINYTQAIQIPPSLKGGIHFLYVRVQNTEGIWGISEYHILRIQNGLTALQKAEYFFDTDPGQGSGFPLAYSSAADSIVSVQNIVVPTLSLGQHKLYVRTMNEQHTWSFPEVHSFIACTTYGPVAAFNSFTEGNEVYFTDASTNSIGCKWLFGDNTSDTTHNPRHIYAAGNTYTVKLIAINTCGNDTLTKIIDVKGIQSVSPQIAPSTGIYIAYLTGVGFSSGSSVTLSKAGSPDIVADTCIYINSTTVKVVFYNFNEALGKYKVTLSQSSGEMMLDSAVSIEPATEPEIWVRLEGRKEVLINKWSTFHLIVGNKGNKAAIEIPIFIELPGNIEVKTINMIIDDYEFPGIKPFLPEGRFYIAYDSITNESVKVGYFIIPYLEGGATGSLTLEVKTGNANPFYIKTAAEKPWLDETAFFIGKHIDENNGFCDPPSCAKCLFDLLGFTPVACVPAAYNYFCKINELIDDAKNKKRSEVIIMLDCIGSGSGMLLSCLGGSATGILKKFADAVDQGTNGFSAAENCYNCKPIPPKSDTVKVRFSWDPNIKEGPSGYNTLNYTTASDPFAYSIHFENLSSATAPASEVSVTDYLDATKFDLNTFRIAGFGFADTSVRINLSEAVIEQDIDLRPSKNSIVRFSGSIDSVNKLSFKFTTFDPATMKLTNSIDDGFLNPNVNGTEGLGYVSFMINPKTDLSTGTIINNMATIVFDNNDPIITNIWSNGIDKNKPASNVMPDIQKVNDSVVKVFWNGTDEHSGVFYFRIMVSENGGPYSEYLRTEGLSGLFVIKDLTTYSFYSIAEDFTGNIEDAPLEADLVLSNTANIPQVSDNHKVRVFPNPTKGETQVIGLEKGDELRLSSTNGKIILRQYAVSETELIDIGNYPPGVYILTIITGSGTMQNLKIVKN